MYVYHLRAEKPGLHPNLTCVHGDRGCGNTIPGDVTETRGFALSVPNAKTSLKGSPRATHCTDSAQTFGKVTPTVELCPPHLTFPIKVRARRDVSEEQKNDNYTYTYNLYKSIPTRQYTGVESKLQQPIALQTTGHLLLLQTPTCFSSCWHCVSAGIVFLVPSKDIRLQTGAPSNLGTIRQGVYCCPA